jgi:hypothetical protein
VTFCFARGVDLTYKVKAPAPLSAPWTGAPCLRRYIRRTTWVDEMGRSPFPLFSFVCSEPLGCELGDATTRPAAFHPNKILILRGCDFFDFAQKKAAVDVPTVPTTVLSFGNESFFFRNPLLFVIPSVARDLECALRGPRMRRAPTKSSS